MKGGANRWIKWTTTGCVALLALIAGTVSYLRMHTLVALHGQPGWGGRAHSVVSRRDDCRGIDHPVGRLAFWLERRGVAVGVAGGRQRGEPSRQCRGGRAHRNRPDDRGLAQLCPDCVV
jgi:hypothetical protein